MRRSTQLPGGPRRSGQGRFKTFFFLLVVVPAAALLGLALFRVGPSPKLEIDPGAPGVGPRTPIRITAGEPERGLSTVRVEIEQGERRELLAERSFAPRPFWAFWGPRTATDEIAVEVGREIHPWLAEGEATVRVTAARAGTWLRHPEPASAELALPVRLRPPSLEVTSSQNYVAQGGSAVVTYRVGEGAVDSGVRIGDQLRFPGYPLPGGGPRERFALFAAPHDLEDAAAIRLVAVDELGNRAEARFVDRYFEKPLKTDTIQLSAGFMERVVPEILARTPGMEAQGDVLASYLAVNGELRRRNALQLAELAAGSRPEWRWRRAFLQQPNTQRMASFAERRTYLYDGREVDLQDHLGFDLASVRRAPIVAANDGVVVLAEYFGIYGNTVVLDHGYGLLSLYAHLSSIDAEVGQRVARGDVLGRSGETGLAGGDHLHFSMLVHGVQVNPLEWWDRSWIRDRVAAKLPGFELEP
jgi:murein DD-endopeptidase MepM/ murein hydrolase activator NlpD